MNRKTINIILMLPSIVAAILIPMLILTIEVFGAAMSDWDNGVEREPDFQYVIISSLIFAAFFLTISVGVLKGRRWALVINFVTLLLIDLEFAFHNFFRMDAYRKFISVESLTAFGRTNSFYIMMLLLNLSFAVLLIYLTGRSWMQGRDDKHAAYSRDTESVGHKKI